MHDTECDLPNRDDLIVTYLYDDLDAAARSAFEAHLSGCAPCRAELSELGAVRRRLGAWETPPAVIRHQSPVPFRAPAAAGEPWWHEVPTWARAAAAVVCIGAAAGLANLDIRYNAEGLAVRTGWLTPAIQTAAALPEAAVVAGGGDPPPWRADLAALDRQLRTELRATDPAAALGAAAAPAAPSMSEAEVLRRMRGLVRESERRQERELALRIGQVMRSVDAQRQADLRKIDSSLGLIQTHTGAEVMRQRQLLMNYLVRASSQK